MKNFLNYPGGWGNPGGNADCIKRIYLYYKCMKNSLKGKGVKDADLNNTGRE